MNLFYSDNFNICYIILKLCKLKYKLYYFKGEELAKFRTHYDNLKVSRSAPPEVIKAAYRVLSQKYHPDLNQSDSKANDIMQIINEAYGILSDPKKREEHDKWIAYQEAINELDEMNTQSAAQEEQSKSYAPQQSAQEEQSKSDESKQATPRTNQTQSESDQGNLVKGVIWLLVLAIILWLIFSEKTVNHPSNYVDEKSSSNTESNANLVSNEPSKEFLANLDAIKKDVPENYQTSFDCTKAKSTSEILICQNIDLAQADRELAELVRIAKLEVSDTTALTNRLKKQWNFREKTCKDVECLNIWYEYQKDTLSQIIQTKNVNIGLPNTEIKQKPTPFTGYMGLKEIAEAVVPFQLTAPSDGNNYLIKMENRHTYASYQFFVRSGDVLETKVPIGMYTIKYAYGKNWYGSQSLFGTETAYVQLNESFDFSFDGYNYNGYTVELIKQLNGNLKSNPIGSEQF